MEALGAALMGALLALLVGFVGGRRTESSASEAKLDRIQSMLDSLARRLGEAENRVSSQELRMVSQEKDVTSIREGAGRWVTGYELERRIETAAIVKDELRRRIVVLERRVLGHDLDGADRPTAIVVPRNVENGEGR